MTMAQDGLRLAAGRARRAADAGGVCRQGGSRPAPARTRARRPRRARGGPASRSTASPPTWCAPSAASRPTWPTSAAPAEDAARDARRGGPHEHDRLHASPGCTGAILDGYCDVCGSPGTAGGPPVRNRARRVDGGVRPVHPAGLHRTIVDGYCDVCGSRPAGGPTRWPRRTLARRSADEPAAAWRQSPVDRVARRPTSFARPPLGSHARRRRQQDHPAGRHVVDPAAGARLGAGLTSVPPIAGGRRRGGDHEEPDGARRTGGPARRAGRPVGRSRDGQPGPDRGLLPDVPQPVLLHPKLQARRRGRRPVRGRRLPSPTAAWAGSTWPATATSPTAGWCSRAC